ncbi:hypothetical protein VTU32_08245 [Thermoanaerobacter sp. CM-CNRG TB177]|uniref:Uncharacterized protein n=1 Tax=Caldanaerobacter subterraneus TaxID=911092 RepID=A0A4R2KD90_9THEO|nr:MULTISPECIES: hypothetical protein [Thermoanaerobacteraceae]MBT1280262.1 hypothetical protein [Thermoanaerobacter sp. CM-CNRG TB177]MDI3519242.1 hypothetical protein [Caldanaerobacter sp.]TCO68216.1 hypothetical protein EV203_103113 [Caldanaerobacter subterraneus]
MLYLVNFVDPNDRDIQMNLIINTTKNKEEVEQIIENILEKSKTLWSEDPEAYLSEILAEELSKEFEILDYTYLSFCW